MKKLILAAAFVLALAGSRSIVGQDPMPSCPPMCDDGGQIVASR